MSATQSIARPRSSRRADKGGSLILALEGARPLALPGAFSLAGVNEIRIGRGDERRESRSGDALRIDVANPRMSQAHARLRLEGGTWTVTDLGSKNGTFVNGKIVNETEVEDGDVLEAGATIFILRPQWRVTAKEESRPAFRTLIPDLAAELATLERVARAPVPLLVQGESGTGKEVLARAVHDASGRRGAFVPVNCGALPANLIESELFGAKKGAFSGALADRPGLVSAAHQGTLLLDEIAGFPEAAQATLLRVLQEGEVRPLGGTVAAKVNLRVIAATHVDLAARVEEGRFRRDLLARLRGYRFTLPPLRERRDDLGLFIGHILRRVEPARADKLRIERDAMRALFAYSWPMNVRELEHALRAACAIAQGDDIELAHLPEELRALPPPPSIDDREGFLEVVRANQAKVSAIARALSTSRSQVRRLAKRYGVDLGSERGE